MTLSEYRLGLKAYYEQHQHEWPEKNTPWDNFMRDKAIENAYKKTLAEPVLYRWFDGQDREAYKKSLRTYNKYGFVESTPAFEGPFADFSHTVSIT